ncbi:MAG: class I SAM-dependent methyltransferase [Gammaproteobacteria bacterium]|nr:class I SAM-dependent methyltransferase [Gammaproteobacteria bacterium]
MSGFSAEWLALREPVDAASRNPELTARLIAWRQRFATFSVLDLASGTGANFRFLAPLLGREQHWRLVDHDPTLLARNGAYWPTAGTDRGQRQSLCLDLASDWESLDFQAVQLVTASALLDLVSADWLERLAQRCWAAHAAVCIVLSYDGALVWEPALTGDEPVRKWVNRHQRRDKGFGPALGPWAAPEFKTMLERWGYRVALCPSPWQLDAEQGALQTALLEGWVDAASEMAPDSRSGLHDWALRRRALIEQGVSRLQVGHWDLWAEPS